MGKYQNASKGLSNLFLAEFFVIIDTFLVVLGVISSLLGSGSLIPDWALALDVIIGEVLGFLGVFHLSLDAPEVKSAFHLKLIALVLSIISGIIMIINAAVGETIASLVSLASAIINLIVLYRVLMSGGRLCGECGREDIQKSGKTVWILKIVSIVASAVVVILGAVGVAVSASGSYTAGGIMVILTVVLAIALSIVELIASIKYIVFLYKGSKALE